MLYLFVDNNQIKLLSLKKSILGQYEVNSFSKNYQSEILSNGKIVNIDFVASATKEAIQACLKEDNKDKDTLIILPQESFNYLRIEIPKDIANSAVESFVKDKARSSLPVNLDECLFYFFTEGGDQEKIVHFFAIEQDALDKFKEAFKLIDLKLVHIIPETVAYFTLFKKTLRKEKKENILYVCYEKDRLTGFLYDSYGLSEKEKWLVKLDEKTNVAEQLKIKATDYEQKGKKLNRIILAGEGSQDVRQDTFTKEVGVWTNPLKRIIPEFYGEYLKILLAQNNKPFTFLSFEVCVGAFIFSKDNKQISLKKNAKGVRDRLPQLPKFNLPTKELMIFLVSFVLSFVFFLAITRLKSNLSFLTAKTEPTVTPVMIKPTSLPLPSSAINKIELKIKVLNGSGTKGKASEVKDLLKEKGYQEILTGNADNFDYEKTELQIKKSKKQEAEILKNDLRESVSSFKESILAEDQSADIVIIIGSDFK